MEEQIDDELPVHTASSMVEGGDTEAVTVSTSLGADFTNSQSQWALVPQNTLITFHTLPFNLDQIDGATNIETINDVGQITSIHDDTITAESIISNHNVIDGQGHFPDNTVVTDVVDGTVTSFSAVIEEALTKGTGETSIEIDDLSHDTSSKQVETSPQDFAPPIFSQISATLSSALLDSIPGSHSVLVQEIQTEVGTHLKIDCDKEYTIIGSINMLVRVHNKLLAMIPSHGKSRLEFVDIEKENDPKECIIVEKKSRGSSCNLLVPLVSSHGRVVHQPIRYSGCVQLGELDQDDDDYQPRVARRSRKLLQPRKVVKEESSVTVVTDVKQEDPDPTDADNGETTGEKREHLKNYKKKYEQRTPYKFFCDQCSFKTKRDSHMSKHALLHEKNTRLYPCSKCNFIAIRYSVMRRHEITHNENRHSCVQCSYTTDTAKLILRHIRLKHSLMRHTSTRTKKFLLNCPECSYKTYNNNGFERHLQMHMTNDVGADQLSYQCTDCNYKTNRKEHYLRHRTNVHSSSRPYLCDTCGMAFKRRDTLVQHKFTHQERKERTFSYLCKLCDKGFRSQAHLKEHLTMHSSDRPFLCDHCGASFKTQNVQRKHVQTIHLNPRSFNCDRCTKRFNTGYALRRHVRTHDTPGMRSIQNVLPLVPEATLQTVQTAEVTEQQTLVQDVIEANIEETYEQSGDGLRQAYNVIPNNETTTALLYLTSNLQL